MLARDAKDLVVLVDEFPTFSAKKVSLFATGYSVTEDEVKRHALAHGPTFQHPRHVVFVPELPLASTGKVDRVALRRLALEHGQMEAKG